jgi:hypothetical protein
MNCAPTRETKTCFAAMRTWGWSDGERGAPTGRVGAQKRVVRGDRASVQI